MEPSTKEGIKEAGTEHDEKTYIKSKKKWKDFQLHQDIIDVLLDMGMKHPTRVQSETLEVTTNPDRKKFNILVRAANGSGKTMSFLLPILNALQPNLKNSEDKTLYSVSYQAKERFS